MIQNQGLLGSKQRNSAPGLRCWRPGIFMISGMTKGFEFVDLDSSEIDLLERFKFFERLNFIKEEYLENAVKIVQYPKTIAITKCSLKGTGYQDILYSFT